MGKYRPSRGGGRLPRRAGGSTGGKLKASVDGVTSALQTQRQAWSEVIASLNEYRALELPDISANLTAPTDLAVAWQELTAGVNAYSAAIAAVPAMPAPAPTVATFAQNAAVQTTDSTATASTVMTADPTAQIAALNAVDVEIDDQGSHWSALAALVEDVVDVAIVGFGEIVATSLNAAEAAIDQHAGHWQSVSQSIAASVSAITATIDELANVPGPAVPVTSETPTDSTDIITATTDAIAEQSTAWQELATTTATAAESTAASVAAMQELLATATQTQSGLQSVNEEIVSGASASREQLAQTMTVVSRSEASWSAIATTAIGALTVIGQGVMLVVRSKDALAVANVKAVIAETTLATATMNASAAQSLATAAIGGQTAATMFAIPPTFTLAGAMAVLTAPLTLIVGGLALAGAALYYFTRRSDEATDATNRSGDAAEDNAKKAGSLSIAYEAVAEQAKQIQEATQDTGSGLSAMQTATQSLKAGIFPDDTQEQLQGVAKEAGKVVIAWGELKATLAQPVIDAGMALGKYIADLIGLKSAAESATATLKLVGQALEWTKGKTKEYTTALAVMAHMVATGSTEAEAKAYVEQGQKILETSARIEAMTARLEEQRKSYAGYRQAVDDATASAAHGAEMNRIGSITTIAGIEAERAAIAAKAAAEFEANAKRIANLQKKGASSDEISAEYRNQDKATEQRTEALKKLAELEEGINSGRVETGIDAATRKTTEAIRELTLGHTENTIALMRAEAAQKGQLAAFEAGLPAYREAQAALAAAKEATDAKKKADEEAERAIQKVADANKSATANIETLKDKIAILNGSMSEAAVAMKNMQAIGLDPAIANETARVTAEFEKLTTAKKGVDKITALKDQIDQLNGSATAAQIAMRELGREGFSAEQIAEIGALTAQVDALKESQKKTKSATETTTAPAFVGSKEAAEVMLRGVGGGNRMESLAGQQLEELKKLNSKKEPILTTPPPVAATPSIPQHSAQTITVPPMPEPADAATISPATAPPVMAPLAPVTIVPPTPQAVAFTPSAVTAPAEPVQSAPLPDLRAANAARMAEADAARARAENAARRADLNEAQIQAAGQTAWEHSERSTAPRMEALLLQTSKPEAANVVSPATQIPTAPQTTSTLPPINVPVPQTLPNAAVPMAAPPSAPPSVAVNLPPQTPPAASPSQIAAPQISVPTAQIAAPQVNVPVPQIAAPQIDVPTAQMAAPQLTEQTNRDDNTRPVPVTIVTPTQNLSSPFVTQSTQSQTNITNTIPPLEPPAAPLTATAAPATAAPVLTTPATSIVIPKTELPRFELPLQRAAANESAKISGVSERVSEPRRENRDQEIVDLLRSLLQEEKLNTAAIKEIDIQVLEAAAV